MTKRKVFIAGPADFQVIALFKRMGFVGTNDLMDAHLCVFTGGSDINTELYGEDPIRECGWFNEKRDEHEVKVYHNCREFDIPMIGICRGAQLLNVMNGGTLWQHVDGHRTTHEMMCCLTGNVFDVTSSHHQMMKPAENAEVIGVAASHGSAASLCTIKMAHGVDIEPGQQDRDPEVIWYEDTQCLCVQFHPEYESAPPECVAYFEQLVSDFFN